MQDFYSKGDWNYESNYIYIGVIFGGLLRLSA